MSEAAVLEKQSNALRSEGTSSQPKFQHPNLSPRSAGRFTEKDYYRYTDLVNSHWLLCPLLWATAFLKNNRSVSSYLGEEMTGTVFLRTSGS